MTQPDEVHSEFERRLLDQYRAAADEQPPAALDRAVLDNARRAAAESAAARPRAGGPAPRFAADVNDAPRQRREEARWGRPLALAAAVVLGIGVVVRYQMESPDLSPPSEDKAVVASAPVTAPATQAPATSTAASADNKAAAASPPASPPAAPPVVAPTEVAPPPAVKDSAAAESTPAPARAREGASRQEPAEAEAGKRRAAEVHERRAPDAREKKAAPAPARVDSYMRDNLAREEADQKIRQQAAAELQKAQPGGPAQDKVAAAPAPASAAGGVAGNLGDTQRRAKSLGAASGAAVASAPAAAPAPAAIPPPPAMAPPPPPPAPAIAAKPDTPIDAAAAPRAPFYEGDPDLWARRIIEMRRAGRNQSADADLRRLRARYPGFKVPAEALPPAPPAAPATPQ